MSKLLIKFPTRQRKGKFFQVLNKYYEYLSDIENTKFVITLDSDDLSMNNPEVKAQLSKYQNLEYYYGNSKTKIQAVNADVPESGWDILLLASDDMIPIVRGYDQIIRDAMSTHFPDTDGVLWFFDGHRRDLNTLCILGFKYYQRFHYIYYPGYITWWADNEFTDVANKLGRQIKCDQCIIEHQHYVWMHRRPDILAYKETMHKDTKADEILYIKRQSMKKLSILICTIVGRDAKLKKLLNILEPQINNDVEVLFSKDNGQFSIGAKRNALLQDSNSEYVCFIDDDDRVSKDYIKLLFEGINKGVDCCSLTGIITVNGKNAKKFIHSIQYNEYFEKNKIYYRPPNHLNCIKSEIAKRFIFPDINTSEDTNWAMQIANAGVLKTEHWIEDILYYYDYQSKK